MWLGCEHTVHGFYPFLLRLLGVLLPQIYRLSREITICKPLGREVPWNYKLHSFHFLLNCRAGLSFQMRVKHEFKRSKALNLLHIYLPGLLLWCSEGWKELAVEAVCTQSVWQQNPRHCSLLRARAGHGCRLTPSKAWCAIVSRRSATCLPPRRSGTNSPQRPASWLLS